ncbi:MAG: ATP synthase F1 subunit epsilon [Deltaproteobacteria bacterium]|nr:ATP synthase F1 subunit epsilon [Deltaproteobacteria bacterium]
MAENEKVHLTLVTPHAEVAVGPADQVIIPAHAGEMGILPGHDRVLALLNMGALKVINGNSTQTYFVAYGFAEVDHDNVRVLAGVCEPVDAIDIERAKEAQLRAEERLKNAALDPEIDVVRARAAIDRAMMRQILGVGAA